MPALFSSIESPASSPSLRATRVAWGIWLGLVLLGVHWPSLSLPEPSVENIWALFPIDKIGHGCGFFGLVVWSYLAWCRPAKGHRPRLKPVLIATALILTLASVSEFTQRLVGGRSFDLGDTMANLTGTLAGFLIVAPRPQATAFTAWAVWLSRLAVLALCFPLYQLWGTVQGGQNAFKLYDLFHIRGPHPDLKAHFALGWALTLALSLARLGGIKRPRFSAIVTCLTVVFIGPFMEIVQANAGRGGLTYADVAAHEKGFLLGLATWATLLCLQAPGRKLLGVASPHGSLNSTSPATTNPSEHTTSTSSGKGFVGAAALVSGLTLVSRLTGLVRDAALAAVFGLGWVADAFFVAFLVPNLFRRLFGEGALTAAFIPRYTKLLKTDPALAQRFATCCVSGLTVLLVMLTLTGEGLCLWLLGSADSQRAEATLELAMVMLPYMPLICGVAFLGAILQVHGRFGPPAAAPVVLNLVLVLAATWCGPWFNHQSGGTLTVDEQLRAAMFIGWAILAAGCLQLAWQAGVLLRITKPVRGAWAAESGVREPLKQMLWTMLPMLIGLGIFQINAMTDALIAFLGSPPPEVGDAVAAGNAPATASVGPLGIEGLRFPLMTGDVAALQWAQRLYQFPLGVFGIAIATAIFPLLSRHADEPKAFADTVRQGLRLTVFIGVPATVGMLLVALPLTRAVYQRAAFDLQDAQHVATILTGYAIAIWAYSVMHTLTRAFYALDDAKTPLKISVGMVGLNLCLNLCLIWPLGARGLAWSTAICAILQCGLLLWRLQRKQPEHRLVNDFVLNGWLRTLGITTLMALVLAPLMHWLQPAELTTGQNLACLFGATALGGLIYFTGSWLTQAQELHLLRRRRK